MQTSAFEVRDPYGAGYGGQKAEGGMQKADSSTRKLRPAKMFKGASPRRVAGPSVLVSFSSLALTAAMVLNCWSIAAGQAIKAAVVSTTLEATSFPQWSQDLGYQKTQLYPLTLTAAGCPLVDVDLAGVKVSLLLDSGTARGLVITNNAPPIPHRVEERMEELNADGSHRGESFRIRVGTVSVLGEVFKNVAGGLSDWRMFSSEPFNGTVGLDFFLDRRLTLDYRSRKVGVTASPLPAKLDRKRYLSVALIEPPKSQGHILYARARVNGREAIVYFDTGHSISFIDPAFTQGLARVERPRKFKVFREGVPLELGGHRFVLDELRESSVRRGTGFDLPVALVLGSDALSRFVVTIDLRAKKLVLALADFQERVMNDRPRPTDKARLTTDNS